MIFAVTDVDSAHLHYLQWLYLLLPIMFVMSDLYMIYLYCTFYTL